jgi:RNA polymerase sigma-70 factor (ECF subfamily)
MHAALEGDQRAYCQLLEALSAHLRAVARHGCVRAGLSVAEAEDVVQETLLAIHLKRHTWDRSRPIAPWIAAIVRYKLIDAIRRRGVTQSIQVDELAEILPADDHSEVSDGYDAQRALTALDGKQRDILQSISIDGRSVRETAQKLQMKEVAVRVALHRALKKLAATYRHMGPGA